MLPFLAGESVHRWLLDHPEITAWVAAMTTAIVLAWLWKKNRGRWRRESLAITSARWVSVSDPSRFIDVAKTLNGLIHDNKLDIIASDELLGDPHPGVPKRLNLEFSRSGFVSVPHGKECRL